MCNNLTIEEVIYVACVDENGDGLLFQKSSNFHRLRVGVAGQCVNYVVGHLRFFLHGFFFRFKGFFIWFIILFLHWFNHKEPALFAAMFSAPWLLERDIEITGVTGYAKAPMQRSGRLRQGP
ncbi:hypothetical protein BHE74_00042919, partial [Ensete ventricosum]